MNNIIELEPCYLLHSRKYTDTKNIISVLSKNNGVVSAVIRIQKRKNIHQTPSCFTLLKINYFGKKPLKTISSWEFDTAPTDLKGKALFCGLYLNELLTRLLHEGEESKSIFILYEKAIKDLDNSHLSKELLEVSLRNFEFGFLRELGFGVNLYYDADDKHIENNNSLYLYQEQAGFKEIGPQDNKKYNAMKIFSGQDLYSIRENIWAEQSLLAAKRLSRLALYPLLGGKPLVSKELFK